MRLTVIGSWGAYPEKDGATSCYLLEEDGFLLALDMGSGALMKLSEKTDLCSLNAVYISHFHADHVADIGCLQYAARVQTELGRRSIPVTFYAQGSQSGYASLAYKGFTVSRSVSPEEETRIGPFNCAFHGTNHPDGGLAVRISCGGRSVVYTGDTGWSDSLPAFCRKTDLLLCESSLHNRYAGLVQGHMTAGEAGRLAAESEAGMLVLCHFPHLGSPAELVSEAAGVYGGTVEPALPGRIFNLDAGGM